MLTDEEMVKSIKKKLKSGYPAGEMKNELLDEGYTESDIEDFFFDASGHSREAKAKARQNNTTAIFNLIGAGLLIMGIAVMSTESWLKEYGNYLLIASGVCFVISVINNRSGKRRK